MNAVVPAIVDIFLTGRPRWQGPAGEGSLARIDAAWLSLLVLAAAGLLGLVWRGRRRPAVAQPSKQRQPSK